MEKIKDGYKSVLKIICMDYSNDMLEM